MYACLTKPRDVPLEPANLFIHHDLHVVGAIYRFNLPFPMGGALVWWEKDGYYVFDWQLPDSRHALSPY